MRTLNKPLHTFAILAYKESEFLENCILSILAQTSNESAVFISTSTPNQYISQLANKYGLEIKINPISKGIAADWTFAYQSAETTYVTLAHQDDIYLPDYSKKLLDLAKARGNLLICFSDYAEIQEELVVKNNSLLFIKRVLLCPYYFKNSFSSFFFKRLSLSFGNPICCPAVMFNKRLVGDFIFPTEFTVNLDWASWLALSALKGSFGFVNKILMHHRVHQGAETSAAILDNRRFKEDEQIYNKIWPTFISKALLFFYKWSYKSQK